MVKAMGLDKRQGNIHDAVEDANLAWQVAATFYVMDNQISTPKSRSGVGLVLLATIVIGLLAWWLF